MPVGIWNQGNHRQSKQNVPILLYHRVSDHPAEGIRRFTVSPATFEWQMGYLARAEYNVVGLDDLVEHYANGGFLPKKAIVITFDDGYLDNYTSAFPVLARYGFKATIFLVADFVGRMAEWDVDLGTPVSELLSWDHAREMMRGGIRFGAHTCTHPHLIQLPPRDARHEIEESKRVIEEELQSEARFFAYPYQDYNQMLRGYVIQGGYATACSSIWGKTDQADDPFMRRRMVIMEHYSNDMFQYLVKEQESGSLIRRLLRGKRSALRKRVARLAGGVRRN